MATPGRKKRKRGADSTAIKTDTEEAANFHGVSLDSKTAPEELAIDMIMIADETAPKLPSVNLTEQDLVNDDAFGTKPNNRQVLTPLADNNLAHFEEDEVEKYKKEMLSKKPQQRQSSNQSAEDPEELEKKKELASKSMKFLLSRSMTYSNYFKDKLQKHVENNNNNTEKPQTKTKSPRKLAQRKSPQKHTLKATSTVDVAHNQEGGTSATIGGVTETDIIKLKYFEGVLKPYQVEGVMWMTILFENGVNGILADEMGLGKTVQIIALICYLYEKQIKGPFLVVAPLSTIPNWMAELKRFAPKLPAVLFHGDKENRTLQQLQIEMHRYELDGKFVAPIIVTTYQMPLKESQFLAKHKWQYMIIDEGHRLKNHESKLSKELRTWHANNKLLLTGTPLQNNLVELWALLNFVVPDVFVNMDFFTSLLLLENIEDDAKMLQTEETTSTIKQLHNILAPFMLRRLKSESLKDLVPKKEVLVYCPLSKLQRDLYMYIIQQNLDKLEGKEEQGLDVSTKTRGKRRCTEKKYYKYKDPDSDEDLCMQDAIQEQKTLSGEKINRAQYLCNINMQNPQAMFRKVVNHPYLVHFPLDPNGTKKQLLVDEQLVQQSGKMMVLDAMLTRLKKGQHKVLIFSTMVMILDQIEEYVLMRDYKYCRLDGRNKMQERQESIHAFNTDPEIFIFLISSRAGGLGVNLTAADTVILYDRDWNPQIDIQAQDRCHRIGQTKPVMVYSLVTKNTIDEQIIKRGNMKRKMEKIVIKDRSIKSMKEDGNLDLDELRLLLKSNDCTFKIHTNGYVLSDEELDAILDRTELYEQMSKLNQPSTSGAS